MSATAPCIRGCSLIGQHYSDCTEEGCRGCLPRRAEHGHLCHSCHRRLRNLVRSITVQHDLLRATAGDIAPQALTAETQAKILTSPRTDSGQPYPPTLYAKAVTVSASESEPVRLGAHDAAQELADWLSRVVDLIVSEHSAIGPERLRKGGDGREWKWHPLTSDGYASDFDPPVKHQDEREVMRGQYLLTDPPPAYAVTPAASWLYAWLDRFEALDMVGDELEYLGEVMSRCHALAPWREEAARVPGIPCPGCKRLSLMRFGGDEDIQCTTPYCRETISPGRYAIWVRMLVDERSVG